MNHAPTALITNRLSMSIPHRFMDSIRRSGINTEADQERAEKLIAHLSALLHKRDEVGNRIHGDLDRHLIYTNIKTLVDALSVRDLETI